MESNNPSLSGSLLCNNSIIIIDIDSVGAQQMWSEIRNMKGEGGGMGVHDKLAFEFFFEERVWQMVSMIDQFDMHKISKEVLMRVEEKMRGEETNSYEVIDFIQALGTVML
jgi:hypothetical protein